MTEGVPEPGAPPGWRLTLHDSLPSTSDHCITLAEAGEPSHRAVLARRQTRARGSRGRGWAEPAGNLAVSVMLRPDAGLAPPTLWPFLSAVALHEALSQGFHGSALSLKWPNDLLLQGRKLAGILIERGEVGGQGWLVIGFGANLARAPDLPDRVPACLAELGVAPEPAVVACRLLTALDRWMEVAQAGGFLPVRDAWLARAHPVGTPLAVRAVGAHRTGLFAGLAEDGALLLRVDTRLERFATGEILLLEER